MDELPQTPILSVVVPSFNERPNVRPLVERLHLALGGTAWEVIYVDDDSPDGTVEEARRIAQTDPHVRCIRRVGRRGLASAVIEGALSSSASYIAVIDGDLQHDETLLPEMLRALQRGEDYDLVVASRHVEGGDNQGLAGKWRHVLSDGGIYLAQMFLQVPLSDPMSGYFMLRRSLFDQLARDLNGQGFKILLDVVMTAPGPLRVLELPSRFNARVAGESKMSPLVMLQFLGLLVDKVSGGVFPLKFISFAMVGLLGLVAHLVVLTGFRYTSLTFGQAQAIATLVAMTFNFQLNNAITYRDARLRGARMWRGLILFILVCSVGAVANIGIARVLYNANGTTWTFAGAIGAMISAVWNYAVSSTLVWRR